MSAGRALGLYDLAKDPGEKHDLSGDKSALEPAVERFRSFRRTLREISVRPAR
jgi:hypothetical protein